MLTQIDTPIQNLLVVLHDNPDPDALAARLAVGHWAGSIHGAKCTLGHGGYVGRSENRAMVRELKIHLHSLNRMKLERFDTVIMVDTQPGQANHSLPQEVPVDLVIDHHPRRRKKGNELYWIDPDVGATSTLLIESLLEAKLDIPARLATALSYAIRSETQDLGREAGPRDINAFLSVFPLATMKKMARIAHPKLPRSYFTTLSTSLEKTEVYRHLICAHLGEVPYPEIVAEMADFLLQHERISWSLCTGRFQDGLFLSLRAVSPKANAGKVIQKLIRDKRSAGGHDTFAGGRISIQGLSQTEICRMEKRLTARFAELMGHEPVEWKGLVG